MENSGDVKIKEGCEDNETCNYDQAVELTGHGRYNYLLLATSCLIINAASLDMFGFSVVVAAARCDLQMTLAEAGILASAPFAGVLFAFPWGYYADTHGRRQALLISTFVGFILASISSFSMNWQIMFVIKIIECAFSTASFTLIIAMLGECTGSAYRSRYLFIMNSINLAAEFVYFVLAYLILPVDINVLIPWLGIAVRPWRVYVFILALLLGLGAFMLLLLHESPKYLANRGDTLEALEVLKKIYEANGGEKGTYPVKIIIPMDGEVNHRKMTFWDSVVKHTVPIFTPPLVWKSLQLFYLMALCCAVNNVYVIWFPTMVNIFFMSFKQESSTASKGFCGRVFGDNTTFTDTQYNECDVISSSTLYSGMACSLFLCLITLIISKWASRRRFVLITVLVLAGMSSVLLEVVKHPVANMIFFTMLQITAIGIGSVASFFVDLFPTSHRGLATGLGMMCGRLFSLICINIVASVITDYCSLTFYGTAALVFSGVVISFLLPSDAK